MKNKITVPSVQSGSYPLRSGNLVRPLVDGEPAFRRICQAIEAAQSSVWATITFMWAAFEMPDGRGTALDVLDRAARGVDVRLLFWRPDAATEALKRNAFWGSAEQIGQLAEQKLAGDPVPMFTPQQVQAAKALVEKSEKAAADRPKENAKKVETARVVSK